MNVSGFSCRTLALFRLQHEYEEKIELLSEVKEECDQVKENLQRLRQVREYNTSFSSKSVQECEGFCWT